MSKSHPTFTDRERILTTIVSQLVTTQLLAHRGDGYHSASYMDGFGGVESPYVHFAYDQKPVAGDLVIGKTGGISKWKVGFYVEPLNDGALIREVGSDRTCRYSNEDFVPIYGLSKTQLLEGDRYQMYLKVLKAARKADDFIHRFGRVEFNDDGTAILWVRERYSGSLRLGSGAVSKPYPITLKWDRKTTIKAIIAQMKAQGFGTRAFETLESPAPVAAASVALS